MEQSGVAAISLVAKKKVAFLSKSLSRYLLYSLMAGIFCGLGMILAYSASSSLSFYETTRGFANIFFGLSFALSFTLIVFAGSELFTGNVLVMTIGTLTKTVKLISALKLLLIVYIGNLMGATLISLLIAQTGLLNSQMVGNSIITNTAIKMALPFSQAFSRGILCNMLVCLATWILVKLKSETAKMIIVIWCIYGFATAGFEHSIANMALFSMALFSPLKTAEINLAGYLNNMIPVTLGNIIGGALFVGFIYYFIGIKLDE